VNVVLWIIAALLAAAFLASGLMKLSRPREKLVSSGLAWAEDFSGGMVKVIGLLEVLAAVGLVLLAVLDVAPVLVPVAALGLGLVMAGAVVVHIRRTEFLLVVPGAVFLLLAAVVVWGRFGPYAFTA
jgi:hypothetical protein